MSANFDRFLLAYFRDEKDEDGEQIRFAVSRGPAPTSWSVLNGGAPVLVSDVGERGARDPFLVRDHRTGGFHLLATDLRVWPKQDWDRATRTGSRSILVWSSPDLTTWSGPRLLLVAPEEAGNAWAPKAVWSLERGSWMLVWASALYTGEDDGPGDRSGGTYQRMMTAPTADFASVGPAEIYLDLGHDVIDLAFLRAGEDYYRFSARPSPDPGNPYAATHILVERGSGFDDAHYRPVAVDVGREEIRRGEGPAVASAADGSAYLLIDEFGLRGYQLFYAADGPSGAWRRLADAELPDGARHGSLLPITQQEAGRLLNTEWTAG